MINRNYLRCSICKTDHTVRIALGDQSLQKHRFKCRECSIKLEFYYHIDHTIGSGVIECISNCSVSDKEGLVINLHPSLILSPEAAYLDSPAVFIEENMRIFSVGKNKDMVFQKLDPEPLKAIDPEDPQALEVLKKFSTPQKGQTQIRELWKFVNTAWELYASRKGKVCAEFIESEYSKYGYESHPHPAQLIFEFIMRLGRRRSAEVWGFLSTEWMKIWKQSDSGMAYIDYIIPDFHLEIMNKSRYIISEFMDNLEVYQQIFIYADADTEIPENFCAGSSDYERTRKYYATIFEFFCKVVEIPVAIINLSEGRSFDQLINMTLSKYNQQSNAAKYSPLDNIVPFSQYRKYFDNKIRNACFHESVRYDDERDTIVIREKDADREISMAKYLDMCLGLTQISIGMMMFLWWLIFLFPGIVQREKPSDGNQT